MARQANKKIEASDLERYLSQEEGFALEMAALKACKEHQLEAVHGGSYLDQQSGKRRQFDLRVSIGPYIGDCTLKLAIECKTLGSEYPLLVSRLPREPHERLACYLKTAKGKITSIEQKTIYREDGTSPYRRWEMVGKGMARVGIKQSRGKEDEFVSNDEEVFLKWNQALASCIDLVATAWRDFQGRNDMPVYTFVMPLLILNEGDLWVADYDSNGNLAEPPKQVDSCEYFVDHTIECDTGLTYGHTEYTISHLHIFTIKGFRKFISRNRIDANFDRIFNAPDLRNR